MSTWQPERRTALRLAMATLLASLFLAMAGFIYEHFSHGVWSYWMVYAFIFPLVLGTLPALLLAMPRRVRLPGAPVRRCWFAGIACLTAGSIYKGVLEIYGTSSGLTLIFWVAGGLFFVLALVLAVLRAGQSENRKEGSA